MSSQTLFRIELTLSAAKKYIPKNLVHHYVNQLNKYLNFRHTIGPFCCTNGSRMKNCCLNDGSGPDCCTNGGKGMYCCKNGANNPDCCENGGSG